MAAALRIDTLVKNPAESRLYSMDFANLLGASETLSSVTSVLSTPAGPTISSTVVSGTVCTFRIAGGTVDTTYKIEAIVVTSASNTLEGDGWLSIQD